MNPRYLLAAGAALVVFAATRGKKGTVPTCGPAPYEYNGAAVTARIDGYLDQGYRDPANIAQAVATDLFSPHPSGDPVVFPPIVSADAGLPLPGVQCVFDRVGQQVLARMHERGIEPGTDDKNAPVIFIKGDPYDPGYPWEQPKVEMNNYPTPGMVFDVGADVIVDGHPSKISTGDDLTRAALGSALAMAGNFRSEWVVAPPPGAPQSHPYYNPNAKRLRRQMAQLIRYSPFNDARYGQTDVNKAGGTPEVNYMMQPCGRGLNWLPNHADDLARLASGQAPMRTTDLQGNKIGGGSHHMQLWIPAVNLARLSPNIADESLTVTTDGLQWSDGSTTLVPPPVVYQRGIESPIAAQASWGCMGVS